MSREKSILVGFPRFSPWQHIAIRYEILAYLQFWLAVQIIKHVTLTLATNNFLLSHWYWSKSSALELTWYSYSQKFFLGKRHFQILKSRQAKLLFKNEERKKYFWAHYPYKALSVAAMGIGTTKWISVHRSSPWAHNNFWIELGVELSTQAMPKHIVGAIIALRLVLVMV